MRSRNGRRSARPASLRPEPLEPRRLLSTASSSASPAVAADVAAADVAADDVAADDVAADDVAAAEQLFVYELNRARHDPVAYQTEQNLPVDLSYVTPRAPLALSSSLFDSAGFHAEEMAGYDYFAHQSQVTGDWPNKMARDHGYVLPGSWEDDANYIESIAAGYGTAPEALDGLIVDQGVPSLGHRNHLLGIDQFSADDRQIGVGYAHNGSSVYGHYWAIHATRSDPSQTFLTGVAFDDTDADGRYDPGEGLSGVTVAAGAYTTTTNSAGGWSLAVSPGTYTVTASGGSFAGTAAGSVTVQQSSVEVDFVSAQGWPIVDFENTGLPLGTVDLLEIANCNPSAGQLWYRAETTRPGLFTLVASYDAAGGDAEIALYDGTLSPVGTASAAAGTRRIDAQATAAGETFYFKLAGTNAAVHLRIANLVQLDSAGTLMTVYGTAGDDAFRATGGSAAAVVVNGLPYESDAVAEVRFLGGGGSDQADLYDSAGNDRFVGTPAYAALEGDGFFYRLWDCAEVRVEATAGGVDVARLYDSTGDDLYVATPTYNAVSGDGFHNRIRYFEGVHAYATAGGTDLAKFYDSPGDDELVATPTYAAFYAAGFFNRAKFFEGVHVYATAGGVDLARFYDSAGDDQLVATPTYAAVYAAGYFNRASFFEGVHAYATAGGTDVARLYDSAGDDVFSAGPTQAALFDPAVYYNRAKFFEGVHAYATAGGRDVARLFDSAGDDTFSADPTQAALFGTGFYNRAKHFEEVYAECTAGGYDRAHLRDSASADTLQARDDWARLSGAAVDFLFRATGFDHVRAAASSSADTKQVTPPLQFVLDLQGPWQDA